MSVADIISEDIVFEVSHPEAGAPMLPRDRPFRRRYQRRPG